MNNNPSRFALISAFAAIYVVWGSTYLAIRFGVETLPPLLLAGARFALAGAILFAGLRLFGSREKATPRQWAWATLLGSLMMAGGNGLVTWGEQWVPSSTAALLITTVPLFMTLLGWLFFGDARPSPFVWMGLAFGFLGVALLVGPGTAGTVDGLGALVMITASLSWALGSLLSRKADLPRSSFLAAAMQMMGGGAVLLVAGALRGEVGSFDPAAVSMRSLIAFAYLVVFGSIVALSAYVWLLRVTSASAVSTYAFVNPVVAVVLGWLLAGEALGPRAILAAILVIDAVVLIHWSRTRSLRARRPREPLPRRMRSCTKDDVLAAAVAKSSSERAS